MTFKRERLPQRRGSENITFECARPGVAPTTYTATIGYFQDGRPAEVFLRSGKAGSDVAIASQETAIAVSMALQHGCGVETLRAAMPRTDRGEPEGAIGTLLDILAKEGATA